MQRIASRGRAGLWLAVGFAAALAVMAAGAGPALAGYKEGKEAFDKRDYANAWKELEPLAKQGNRDAMYLLGSMHQMGMGVPPSNQDAVAWYRKAADAGKPDAVFMMGVMNEAGSGLPRSLPEAFNWYKKSADRGFYPGMIKIADMYGKGRGVKKDPAQAYMWFTIAERNSPPSTNDKFEIPIVKDRLATLITKEQLADADRKAKAWKPVAGK